MQTSNSPYMGRSPVKLPLRASAEFLCGHKQVVFVLSIGQPSLCNIIPTLHDASYALLLGAAHRQSLNLFAASEASGLGAGSAIRQ
jgi:hypothetical protein